MPAVSLTSYTPDYFSNREAQAGFFKLWLLLTTVPETTAGDTPIPVFYSQDDIDDFTDAQSETEAPAYYVDMTDLASGSSQLAPLQQPDVDSVFGLLNDDARRNAFNAIATDFWNVGYTQLGYPRGGCTSYGRALSLVPSGPDPDQPPHPLA